MDLNFIIVSMYACSGGDGGDGGVGGWGWGRG